MTRDQRKMKDSGVEWLGENPTHWEVKRLKFLTQRSLMYGANEAADDDNPNNPRFIRITDINDDGTLRKDTFRSLPNEIAAPYILEIGDILFARSGATVGKTFRYQQEWGVACFAGYLIRFSPDLKQIVSEFVDYFTSSKPYQEWVNSIFIQATIQNISAEKYANLVLGVPPLHEQHAIASYLDTETARIDALINKTEQLNVLLREKRVALISRAVTKGLDASAEMKDSGVEWLGEIPSHWDIKPAYAITLSTDKRDPSQEPDTQFRYIDVSSISSELHQITAFEELMGFDAPTRARNVVFEGDTIFATVRPYLRNIAVIPIELHDSICSTGYCVLRAERMKLESRYLFYTCISAGFVASVVRHQQGVSYPAVSDRIVRRRVVPLPPLHEQRAIASYLDAETAKIDALIDKNDKLIALLREKRTALISAAVTGKISVSPIK